MARFNPEIRAAEIIGSILFEFPTGGWFLGMSPGEQLGWEAFEAEWCSYDGDREPNTFRAPRNQRELAGYLAAEIYHDITHATLCRIRAHGGIVASIPTCPTCKLPAHATDSDDDHYHAGCRPKNDAGVTVCCSVCGGANVEYAIWYDPNTGALGDAFGTWNWGDNTFCSDCDGNTDLVDRGAEPERFAELRQKAREPKVD